MARVASDRQDANRPRKLEAPGDLGSTPRKRHDRDPPADAFGPTSARSTLTRLKGKGRRLVGVIRSTTTNEQRGQHRDAGTGRYVVPAPALENAMHSNGVEEGKH
jgi:hypothetical protein